MKKLLANLMAMLRRPKWRHGRLSALLIAGFMTVCVLLNIGVKSLEDEYGWRKDYSFNGYATTGEATKAALDRLTGNVELYLLYQGGAEDTQALQVLNRYAVLSPHITVRPTDITKNPGILTRFSGTVTKTPQADSVVINCPDTGRYRILNYQDFLTQGYDVEAGIFEYVGLSYEKKLTEAIVYVTQETIPAIGVLQGHGELSPAELQTLLDFLKSNNYDSVSVNLLSGDTLENVNLLLIANPQKDLGETETQAIANFASSGGSLLCIRDFADPINGMPNYMALLKSYGVTPLEGLVVASKQDVGSYNNELIYLLPYMCELDMTLPLIAGKMDLLLLAGACAFETPPDPDQSLTVATVLKTGPHAYVRNPSDGNTTLDQQPNDRMGELSLALNARRMHANGNVSRLFAIGNSPLFTDATLYQSTYSQEFILQLMGELLPQKSISLDIMASSAFRPALSVGSQTLGIVLMVTVPLLLIMAALCVLLPRQNR